MTALDLTAYGAAFTDPARTAALLRAHASAHDVTISPASRTDLTAAVLGAHTWLVVLSLPSLSIVPGPAPAAALAAVLARAAGHAGTPAAGPAELTDRACRLFDTLSVTADLTPVSMRQVGAGLEWVGEQVDGIERACALLLAAEDLATGGGHPNLAAAAYLLASEAYDQI